MCQRLYMCETLPFDYDETKANTIQPVLRAMLGQALVTCRRLYAQ